MIQRILLTTSKPHTSAVYFRTYKLEVSYSFGKSILIFCYDLKYKYESNSQMEGTVTLYKKILILYITYYLLL